MPFPVSVSFSSNSFPPSSMPPPPTSQKPRPNPTITSGVKRPRPLGLLRSRYPGARVSTPLIRPPSLAPTGQPHRRVPPESNSDSDRDSFLDDTPHARTLVTKHQSQQHHHRQDYISAIPQPGYESSDDDPTNWITRTKTMDVSTTAGPGDATSSDPSFTYDDWLDLKQLFAKACEQYEFDDPAETLPLLRGVIHECHRCLLAHHDPSVLVASGPIALAEYLQEPGKTTPIGPSGRKTRGPATSPGEIPSSFHTLLGTTLFFFGNSIAANPELALPGEPAIPVPYWIAALDVFETGENLPSRSEIYGGAIKYKFDSSPGDYTPPPREDWHMAVMWGRTLVALATEMVDRHRTDPPPPPEPQHFPSPFPTNADYLKTGTIWDDEPRWPPESPFGVIATRRPPITRRMALNNATPHEMLQLAMDHFSRGIFHMPHHTSTSPSSQSQPSRQQLTPQFSRSKALYEIAEEVLLLAEKLEDHQERKEWAVYANSVLGQIHVSPPRRHQESIATTASSSRDTGEVHPIVGEGLVAKARGRTCLVIGSTIAEIIEERMDQGSENDESYGSLIRTEEADEARDALLQAVDFFEKARSYIAEDEWGGEEEVEEENEDDVMAVDDDDDDADDEQEEDRALMSARARGKQRRDSKPDETLQASRLEAKRASRAEARRQQRQEAEEERKQISHLLAEALCSLANLTESPEQQEEYYRRAEAETDVKLFDDDDDDGMDEDN